VKDRLYRSLRRGSRCQQMAVAARQHRQPQTLRGEQCLQTALLMPARQQEPIKVAFGQSLADVGGVATGEAFETRMSRDVLQKAMSIAGQQVDIPGEANPEACRSLIFWRSSMAKKNRQIESPRQLAEKRRLLLHRLRGEDGE